jgi:hypothetical protein
MSEWQPPKTAHKGTLIPEEVRAMMKEGDAVQLRRVAEGVGYWEINGVEVFSGPVQHPA